MTFKPKVLFLEFPQKHLMKQFEAKFDCILYQISTVEQCIEDFQTKLQDVEAIYSGWAGFAPLGGFRGKLLAFAPKRLKIITTCTIGVDHFDVAGLVSRGIKLTNVPSQLAFEAVADLVLYNAITSFRNFKIYEHNFGGKYYSNTGVLRTSLKHGDFDQKNGKAVMEPVFGGSYGESCCGRANLSPCGHNAVIIGFGNIGQIIGARLAAIGMNIHYIKRNKLTQEEEASLGYKVLFHSCLETTKSIADLIVIACPGTPLTKHMIDKVMINKMEKQFRIINIGRGYVIDEDALVDGLEDGKILFAGLDVFEQEPKVHPRLLNRQDVLLTPHLGSSVWENDQYTAQTCLQNIEIALYGTQKQSQQYIS